MFAVLLKKRDNFSTLGKEFTTVKNTRTLPVVIEKKVVIVKEPKISELPILISADSNRICEKENQITVNSTVIKEIEKIELTNEGQNELVTQTLDEQVGVNSNIPHPPLFKLPPHKPRTALIDHIEKTRNDNKEAQQQNTNIFGFAGVPLNIGLLIRIREAVNPIDEEDDWDDWDDDEDEEIR